METRYDLKPKMIPLVFLLIMMTVLAHGQNQFDWMPAPKKWKIAEGKFRLSHDFSITTGSGSTKRLDQYSSRFLRRLDWQTGLFFDQEFARNPVSEPQLWIEILREGDLKVNEDESYKLEITEKQIRLKATTDLGAMRGLETLLQLIKTDKEGFYFQAIIIEDEPRFTWRGLMIDVSRHFQPMAVIKRNIDAMAAVKMNVLHLHLCDDHGFRAESKVFPQLTKKASKGQYFTQEELKEMIRYAGNRGIRVVPEFDVPGHATSFLVAFPELASGPKPQTLQTRAGIFNPTLNPINERTYQVLNQLFTEMAQIFPDEYFHIGGDENEGHEWDANQEIQAYMKKNNITDNHQLQNYFNGRIQKHLAGLGKKMMGWDEILHEQLPKEAVIHSWRGINSLREAAKRGYKCVLSNGFYIDLMRKASNHYVIDPLPKNLDLTAEEARNVLGGEATMWSELVTPITIDSRIWPRTAAIAERLWSPQEVRDVDDMYRRLTVISQQLEEHGLTHLKNREMLMRNLAKTGPIEPLRVIADVAEPLENYTRNPGGRLYQMHYPFNRFADLTIADAPDARIFDQLVSAYQLAPNDEKRRQLSSWLTKWKENHLKMAEIIENSPALKEIETLSENLSKIAQLGLEALDLPSKDFTTETKRTWYEQALKTLQTAQEQGGRTELQVVNPIRNLIKTAWQRR